MSFDPISLILDRTGVVCVRPRTVCGTLGEVEVVFISISTTVSFETCCRKRLGIGYFVAFDVFFFSQKKNREMIEHSVEIYIFDNKKTH